MFHVRIVLSRIVRNVLIILQSVQNVQGDKGLILILFVNFAFKRVV